ncbi:MAG: DNA gyrase inhibitor YacG [Nitrospirae bacterium]|nr:MAG: hypothetical protein D084_Lepto4C00003G0002 [Leptospirillum sp. Group IV 'UBA BS']MCL4484864.1 DNA gyrase inhibitor YacG [Nitrospirota bacterium]MCL5284493.1 DNA gyrase inhibitor YacG [Nitrospirota bacterium]
MAEPLHIRRCPVCRAELPATLRSVFCSDRCRKIDLSRWLSEEYRIHGGEGEGEGTLVHSRETGEDAREEEEEGRP